jgi:hypothetical protein
MLRIISYITLLPCLATMPVQTDSATSADSIGQQKWPAGVTLNRPGTAAFTNATVWWSIYEAPTYSSSLSPMTEEEVADIVGTQA